MKLKKLAGFLLAAAAALTLCLTLTACGEDKTYYVYFGLNDAETGTQLVETDEAAGIIRKIVTDRGLGYTEYVAYGAYVEDDVVYGNDTLVYSLTFCDKDTVLAIVGEAKDRLHLASVMIETTSAAYEFVGQGEKK